MDGDPGSCSFCGDAEIAGYSANVGKALPGGDGAEMSRSVLTVADLSVSEIAAVLDAASAQKSGEQDDHEEALAGKTALLLFQKPSLRTRVSFELAVRRLGGDSIYLSPPEVGLGEREAVRDVAAVAGRYGELIICRTFSQSVLEQLAQYSGVPVVNALSDWEHPCQALADLLTIREHGGTGGRILSYVGDGNNVARSLLIAAAGEGMHVRIACPDGYELDEETIDLAVERAELSGGSVTTMRDPRAAVEDAHVIYTDTWTSMGSGSGGGSAARGVHSIPGVVGSDCRRSFGCGGDALPACSPGRRDHGRGA